jgi:hypothetical protein
MGDPPGDGNASIVERFHSAVSTSPANLRIPASIGEVVDKITILEIKSARLSGERLTNVARERQLLVGCLEAEGLTVAEELFDALRQINAKLWIIEDEIRALEAEQKFGGEFIALARAVYITNDERAAVKRRINESYDSVIVEEKLYANYACQPQLPECWPAPPLSQLSSPSPRNDRPSTSTNRARPG